MYKNLIYVSTKPNKNALEKLGHIIIFIHFFKLFFFTTYLQNVKSNNMGSFPGLEKLLNLSVTICVPVSVITSVKIGEEPTFKETLDTLIYYLSLMPFHRTLNQGTFQNEKPN